MHKQNTEISLHTCPDSVMTKLWITDRCSKKTYLSVYATMKDYIHWLGAYRTNALYSGHIFVRFNDLEDVFT